MFQTVSFGATITSTGAGGNWNSGSTWVGGAVPSSIDDVVIAGVATVLINADTTISINSLTVNGTLRTGNNTITVGVTNNVVVNIGGTLDLESNKDVFLKVFGDYYNNGSTDFWKAYAIIAGDFISSDTSTLQGNGRIAVGGDFIGLITITGGGTSGEGELWPVNPNATVSIGPGTVGSGVVAGNLPTDPVLGGLINEVIYGGTCTSFSLTTPQDVALCTGATSTSFTVAVSPISSPTFVWQVNAGGGWVDVINGINYSGNNTNTLIVSNVNNSFNNYRYRVKVKQGSCTKNSNTATLNWGSEGGALTPILTTVCSGLNSTTIKLNGQIGNILRWESSTNNFSTVSSITNTSPTLLVSNLSASTVYRAVVQSGSCPSVYSSIATVNVNASTAATPTAISATSVGCDTFNANWNSQTNVLRYYLDVSTVNAFTSFVGVYNNLDIGNVNSYTVTGLSSGVTYYYRVRSNNACGTSSSSNTISVSLNLSSVGGTVTGGTTICSGNTSGLLTLSGQTGTVVKWQSSVSPFSIWTDIANTATTYTSGALTSTTQFRAVVQSGSCAIANSAPTNVTISSSNSWVGTTSSSWFTATNWSCGSIPTAASDITIPSGTTFKPIVNDTSKIALANTITVNSGGSLTVNGGNTLKVTDKVTNNGGTITFEDSASLVQINTVTNAGNISYKRNYTGGEMDYTYWSSPVVSQNLLALSPTTKQDKFLSFNGTDWVQEVPSATTMIVGKGYAIRGVPPPSGPPVGFGTLTFNGVPNNGTKTIPVVGAASSNLIGNPYPSAIDADKFILANSTVIDGTLYFWTHNTPIAIGTPDPGTGVYAYSGNDYATYTLSGGVGTSGNFNDINGNGILDSGEEVVSNRPTGKIAAGQSFFTTSTTAGGTVTFTNAMRLDGSGNPLNNSNFYKTKNPKAKTDATIEKHRVWLNLTNEQGAFKQTLVGYITGATNTWDKLYDGESFDGNDFLDFYSINEDKNLTIQGRALPFDENDEVSLGYRIAVAGTFTINIDETDGKLANQDVYLEDKLTHTTINLKNDKYTFSTLAGTFDDRFVLRYTNKTLGTTDFDATEKTVLVSVKNKQIKVSSFGETIDKVIIFDLLGRKLYQKDSINSSEFLLTDFKASHETLIIKTTLQNGSISTEKIMY
ncbi:T9SS sorting signal type C domain-containing protein [Flavobacterium nackdongense]|nr:T9SS sorting signal type C domain-containing protein [Flavobacterium nackdongense]